MIEEERLDQRGARPGTSRREFLAFAAAGPLLNWIPFLRRGHIDLAGARFRIRAQRPLAAPLSADPRRRGERPRGARLHIQLYEGIACIVESHTRNVAIAGGEIDPNRMFSRAGARPV